MLHTVIAWLVIPPYVSRSLQSWLEIVRSTFADDTFIFIAMVVAAHGHEYLKRVRRQEAERFEYQRALAASELQALKMQLQPHFLFNTLHGIVTLIDGDAKNAKAMIIKLSNLLRAALDLGNSDLIPVQDDSWCHRWSFYRWWRTQFDMALLRHANQGGSKWRLVQTMKCSSSRCATVPVLRLPTEPAWD